MGGRAKRLGRFAEAGEYYARGARVSPNSVYMLVNQAALAILRNPSAPDSGIQLYRNLLRILESGNNAGADEWTELLVAEAHFAIGNIETAKLHYLAAKGVATSLKAIGSAVRQLQSFSEVGFRSEEATELGRLLEKSSIQISVTTAEAPPSNVAVLPGGAIPSDDVNWPVLIHLSDLHFGTAEKEGKTISMHRFYDGENSQKLVKHLEDEFVRPGSHFSYSPRRMHLVVSGDLVYRGSESEYSEALRFLIETVEALKIHRRNVHIVPGNHDISWHLARHDSGYRFDPYLSLLFNFYGQELAQEKYPLISWPVSLTSRPAPHDLISFSHHPESGILILGLNSCVYESEQHHYGFVGERQLKQARGLITAARPSPGTLRIALIHHHLLPFPESLIERNGQDVWLDVSTVRDSGFVERSLERLGFDLILHGHKHRPLLRETLVQDHDPSKGTLKRLIVAGAGTASCTELDSGSPNQYQVIEIRSTPRSIGSEFVRVEWRTLPIEAGAEWQTAKSWNILG